MKRLFCLLLCIALVLGLTSCNKNVNENYNEAFQEGYDEGYENGWDELLDIMYDELKIEQEKKSEMFQLIFDTLHDGHTLSEGNTWRAGDFELRYRIANNEYIHVDIKIQGFDMKAICTDLHYYIDNFPISCYVGYYDKHGDYVVSKTHFIGEKIFGDEFEFTSDGYLTDYHKIDSSAESITVDILLFIDGEVYPTTCNIR